MHHERSSTMSIFTNIKRQLVKSANEADVLGMDEIYFTVKGKYFPSKVVNWFYRNGIFAVKEVQKNNRYEYTVSVKDLDREHPMFKDSGLRGRLTEDCDDGFGYRYYSADDTTSVDAYASPNKERIDFRDMTCSDKILYDLHYSSYDEMVDEMGEYYARELANQKARDFENNEKAPEWSYISYTEEEVEA